MAGILDQHRVAGTHQRGEREEVGARRTDRGHDVVGGTPQCAAMAALSAALGAAGVGGGLDGGPPSLPAIRAR